MRLGKLEEVDIRELWKHEQYDFSEWLAKEENMELLSDEIGLTLTDVNQEVFVGAYRCDLVAKDETTGITVVIENQDERRFLFPDGNSRVQNRRLFAGPSICHYRKAE